VQATVSAAIGGVPAGQVIRGRERYGVLVRYPRELRDDPERIASALVATPAGAPGAVGQLARIGVT
jgi:Cu(I)/Ag(I) efflux system membrane protein CusA/SilA